MIVSYCQHLDAQTCITVHSYRDSQSFHKRLQYIKGTIQRFDCNTRKVGQVLVNRHEDNNKIKFALVTSELHFLQVGCVFAVNMVGTC